MPADLLLPATPDVFQRFMLPLMPITLLLPLMLMPRFFAISMSPH